MTDAPRNPFWKRKRWIAAAVLWAALAWRRSLPAAARRTVLAALGLGAIGYATQAGLFFSALTRIDASLLALLLYTYPALVTLTALLLGREPASRRRLGALVLSSAGLALVLLGAGAGALDPLGVVMALGAAFAYTAYILVSDGVVATLDPLAMSALVTTGAALTFGVAGVASGGLESSFASEGWLWIGLFFAGLRRVGPSSAAILSTLEPPVTVLLAFLAFGEALTAVQLAGGALVLAAVVVLNLRGAPAPVPAAR